MMYRIGVHSSNLHSVGYENEILEIAFLQGGVYQYFGVPENIYRALLSAPSKGRFVHRFIRGRYRTRQVG